MIVHLYNSTSVAQRDSRCSESQQRRDQGDRDIAALKLINQYAARIIRIRSLHFEYSPESFTGTEIELRSAIVCNAVIDIWKPTSCSRKVIINLPATVSMSMPHVYACSDRIHEQASAQYRENVIVSLHPHNDRGTGRRGLRSWGYWQAATRIEGTLFGNGETDRQCWISSQ